MKISQVGLDFITEFEGFYSKAYQDQAGIWTIGIGTIKYPRGVKVAKSDTCSKEDANRWLAFEVNEKCAYFNQVLGKINWKPSQNPYFSLRKKPNEVSNEFQDKDIDTVFSNI